MERAEDGREEWGGEGEGKSGEGKRSGGQDNGREKERQKEKNNSKKQGELAEMMFMVKAARMGFAVAKPYGDSEAYDFIVDVRRGLWRVQVRSST